MAGIFSAENTKVTIYLDNGSGSPSGTALWTGKYIHAVAMDLGVNYEQIPHAGYPKQEVRLGNTTYTLQLEKNVENSSRDMLLTPALYYIEIEVWTDNRSAWVKYLCKKCRRTSWELTHPVSGAYVARASFVCEEIVSDDQLS